MQSEFDFINNLKNKYGLSKIGDDAAVLPKDDKTDLVISTDMLVEDIDFRLDWSTPEFIGHKSLAVSLSDIAAMGARPVWSMVSIGVPEKIWKTNFIDEFYESYMNLANQFNVELVGGDVSKTPFKITIDSIVAGEVQKGKAILRSGAKHGDAIYVTGYLGEATTALKMLENGERYGQSDYNTLLLEQLKPTPQTEIGQFIGNNNLATAMIDLSDGLVADLFHICHESNVGATLFEDKIPYRNPNHKVHPIFDVLQAKDKLYFGGEDYELLFTVQDYYHADKLLKNHNVTRIGRITSNTKILKLKSWGKSQVLEPKGFKHF